MSPTVIGVAVPLITCALLIAVGCDLTGADIRHAARRYKLVVAGLVVPPVVLPTVALLLIAWIQPAPGTAMGLLVVATCPVGGISNTFTYLARGAVALSVTLTTFSCLLAIVTIPVTGAVMAYARQALTFIHPSPAWLLLRVFATVVLPVGIGMGLRRRWPGWALRHQQKMKGTAFALLAVLLGLIVGSDPREFVAALPGAVPLAAAFIVVSLVVVGGVGHIAGGTVPERIALAIEFATRNVAVANTLALASGGIEFARFATAYFLTELPLALTAVVVFRAMTLPAATRPAAAPGSPP